MTRTLYVSRFFLALVSVVMTAFDARATASRVFVAAKSGNDANACDSVATPCQTFAGVITQVSAGGEIIVLETGGYGPVTINKAVTINAPDGIIAFVHPPSGDAITINAGATDTVILRGLTLNGGSGNGITTNTVGQLFVEHCTITGYSFGGLQFTAPGGTLFMNDDDVRECGISAVLVQSSGSPARADIRDSSFVGNFDGVAAGVGGVVAVMDSVAMDNSNTGFLATSSAGGVADMTLSHVQAVSNGVGLQAFTFNGGGTATLHVSDSVVTQNTTGVAATLTGSTVIGSSPGTNLVAGNTTDGIASFGTATTLQ